jgi:hypothetical protein
MQGSGWRLETLALHVMRGGIEVARRRAEEVVVEMGLARWEIRLA